MKDIKFINKINKENNSLTTLSIDGVEFPLTEKELAKLVHELYTMREDAFLDYELVYESKSLKERVRELENENDDLEEECNCLRNQLYDTEDYDETDN